MEESWPGQNVLTAQGKLVRSAAKLGPNRNLTHRLSLQKAGNGLLCMLILPNIVCFYEILKAKLTETKNCWKGPKMLRCREAHSFYTIKDISPKLKKKKLKTWMKIVLKFHVPLLCFQRNRLSKSVMVGPGQAGYSFWMSQLVLKWSYKFISIFSKVLELFECAEDARRSICDW